MDPFIRIGDCGEWEVLFDLSSSCERNSIDCPNDHQYEDEGNDDRVPILPKPLPLLPDGLELPQGALPWWIVLFPTASIGWLRPCLLL